MRLLNNYKTPNHYFTNNTIKCVGYKDMNTIIDFIWIVLIVLYFGMFINNLSQNSKMDKFTIGCLILIAILFFIEQLIN